MLKSIRTILGFTLLIPVLASADISVIISQTNSNELNNKEIKQIFLGKSRSFADASRAVAVDLNEGNSIRDQFYQTYI